MKKLINEEGNHLFTLMCTCYFAVMIYQYCIIRCFNKINLFEITCADDIVNNWICLLHEKYNCMVLHYTMHPNRLEMIILFENEVIVQKIIANGKRFMAYEIIFRLYDGQKHEIITELKKGLNMSEIKKGQLHKVFIQNKNKLIQHLDWFFEHWLKIKKPSFQMAQQNTEL